MLGGTGRGGRDKLKILNAKFKIRGELRVEMPASRRVPARLSPEGSETRHLVSYCSKGARPGAWGARADGPGQRRSAERRHGAKFVPLDPRCPAWSRVVPRTIFLGICGTVKCRIRSAECGMGRKTRIPRIVARQVPAHSHQACTRCLEERRGGRGGFESANLRFRIARVL